MTDLSICTANRGKDAGMVDPRRKKSKNSICKLVHFGARNKLAAVGDPQKHAFILLSLFSLHRTLYVISKRVQLWLDLTETSHFL
jgi:hypothetical protein